MSGKEKSEEKEKHGWTWFKNEMKPKTRRQWLKVFYDIGLICFLIYMIATRAEAIAFGFEKGVAYGQWQCMNNQLGNLSLKINFTNESRWIIPENETGLWIPPETEIK